MKWGVFEIVSYNPSTSDLKIKYLPEDKDFKNPPKLTWITSDPIFTLPIKTVEYDYLLTCDKVDEKADFDKVVNRNSRFEKEFLVESQVKNLTKGDIIQFERKGFYILDKKEVSGEGKTSMTFHLIPDGKDKPVNSTQN
jgi:glutamyl-tRNA synthetase